MNRRLQAVVLDYRCSGWNRMRRAHHVGLSWTAMGSCVCNPSLAAGSVLSCTMKVKRLTFNADRLDRVGAV